MCERIKEAGIEPAGVFMNADAGFDTAALRPVCRERNIEASLDRNPRNTNSPDAYIYFDEQLYKKRYAIERTNAWIDGIKARLVR
jgi:hypothetical protein